MAAWKVDKAQWAEFWLRWKFMTKKTPETVRMALYAAGKAARAEVLRQIGRLGVPDVHGRLQRWQEIRMGSEGGYSAVSATAADIVQVSENAITTSADLTRYLEHGHGVRTPSGRAKRYTPRLRGNGAYVKGHLFYSWAIVEADRLARAAAEEAMRDFIQEFARFRKGGSGS